MFSKNCSVSIAAALVLFAGAARGDVVIDHLNDPGLATGYAADGDVTGWAWDTDTPDSSATSLKITYGGNTSWWGAVQGEFATPYNLSAETHIRFWAKADIDGLTVTLHFITGSWGAGASKAEVGPVPNQWTQYEVAIADFVVDNWYNSPGGTNTVPVDWSNVGTFQYQVFGTDAGTVWLDQIEAVTIAGPLVLVVDPPKDTNVALADLTQIAVTFNKSVTGVDAADLGVNGNPATNLSGTGAGPYVFSGYPAPPAGPVSVDLAPGGITDGTNTFAGDSWTYTAVQRNSATAFFAATPPTIDGNMGPGEWPAQSALTLTSSLGTIDGPGDLSATAYALHDADFIYIAVAVTDDEIVPASPARNWWEEDAVEVFVDNDLSRNRGSVDSAPGQVGQLGTSWDIVTTGGQTGLWGPDASGDWNVLSSRPSANRYVVEFAIHKDIANIPSSGTTVGFNIQVQDRDADTPQQGRLWWFGAIDPNPWNNEYGWGDLILSSNVPTPSLAVDRRLWPLYP